MYIPYTFCCIPICPCCFFAPFLRQLQQAIVSNLPLAIRVNLFYENQPFNFMKVLEMLWPNRLQKWHYKLSYSTLKCWLIAMIKKRLKLLLPDRDPICCDLPIIELQKSLFQRCFRIRFFAEPSVFCPKNCTQTAKKAHQNKKNESKSP